MVLSTKINIKQLAGIEYHGEAGITQRCIDAIVRLIQAGSDIEYAWLLSGEASQHGANSHAFLLRVNERYIAIKSGFGSGYGGEGHMGLSKVLKLLEFYRIDIDELQVTNALLRRVDASCLTKSDLIQLESTARVLPVRFHDYMLGNSIDYYDQLDTNLFPYVLPIAIIDPRIMDLAKTLKDDPDARLLTGYRRLEDQIRLRTALKTEVGEQIKGSASLITI